MARKGKGGRAERLPADGPSERSWPSAGLAAIAALLIAAGLLALQPGAHESSRVPPVEESGAREMLPGGMRRVACHANSNKPAVSGCTPLPGRCGQVVLDGFLSQSEVAALRKVAERGMSLGGGAGGPTILDLQSGALSLEDTFIDVWMAFNLTKRKPYTRGDLKVYSEVVKRLAAEIERTFGVSGIMLTAPTFFSRISADKPPRIPNDEYWHSHVDQIQYGSFVFTSLVYLSEQGVDFEGGALCFDSTTTGRVLSFVRPASGRAVLFSSGYEHPHHVAQARIAPATLIPLDRSQSPGVTR